MSFSEILQRLALPPDELRRQRDETVDAMRQVRDSCGLDPIEVVALFAAKNRASMAGLDDAGLRQAESVVEPLERIFFEASVEFLASDIWGPDEATVPAG